MNIIEIEKSEDKELIIKTSKIKDKIEWIKEGFFFDILVLDTNPEVRLEIAKKSFQLETLKDDEDYRVKLEVMKKKGYQYMDFTDINLEHFTIIQEAIEQGFDCKELDTQNQKLKMFVLKNKGYKYCLEHKIIENYEEENYEIKKEMVFQGYKLLKNQIKGELGSLYLNNIQQNEKEEIISKIDDINILKDAIINGFEIPNMNMKKYNNLFKDREFRIKCIENGYYLNYILRNYNNDKQTILSYIENNYGNHVVDQGHYNYSVIHYVNKMIDIELIEAVKEHMPFKVNNLDYDKEFYEEIDSKKQIRNTLKNLNTNVLSL